MSTTNDGGVACTICGAKDRRSDAARDEEVFRALRTIRAMGSSETDRPCFYCVNAIAEAAVRVLVERQAAARKGGGR